LKKIKSFAVIAGAPLSQRQNPCQPPQKQIEPTKKSQRENCTVPIAILPMNSGALAYNVEPLSDVKPLARKRMSPRLLGELKLKKSFLRRKPPRDKRAKHRVGNSSAPPVRLFTNVELLA
jgi:hypothetical protein